MGSDPIRMYCSACAQGGAIIQQARVQFFLFYSSVVEYA